MQPQQQLRTLTATPRIGTPTVKRLSMLVALACLDCVATAHAAPVTVNVNSGQTFINTSDQYVKDSLIKNGAGTLILTGTNSNTGNVQITNGTLQLGNGGTTGSLQGSVMNFGTLVVNRSNDVELNNAITGNGNLTKLGANVVTLTGSNFYSGVTTISAGTLALGNGGTGGGSLNGPIINNGALVVNRLGTVAISNSISGSGTLTKLGAGNLVLSGNNSYTGTTTISAGAVQLGNGSVGGSLVSNVINNSMLVVSSNATTSLRGDLSGTGTLAKYGNGILTLSGNYSYTGNTSILGGTLILGNGSSRSSSLSGNVYNNGSLWVSGSNALTLSGEISGNGSLNKLGTGVLTLTADNSYKGMTSISGGTLAIGNGGTSGMISGDISLAFGSTLAFNRSDDVTYYGALRGNGTLVKNGTGVLVFNSQSNFIGNTVVAAGELRSAGSNSLSVSVASGATLTSSGHAGALTIAGRLSAADGVGRLSAASATFAGGSSYLWEMNDANGAAGIGYDQFFSAGALVLGGSANHQITIALKTLDSSGQAGKLASGFDATVNHSYLLMTGGSGITGYTADGFSVDASDFRYDGLGHGSWSVVANGNMLNLDYIAAVPEPESYAMLLAGLGMLGWTARRRAKSRT